ncbi:sigma-70 family RNA polymerase sigma factor [Paenisporosarcina antarctica]|uniref:Sigma-70 family RNA polymerase sigma factor n=1 Tax=Paenisporosarcina antarctica TaxID=417367 RepID=A0A4V1AN94_9BACL|nr:sigma-70 family RNA polymerase sigma factor [Paenisporosarcina antarctica]QBP41985.1 sigma-70 family RNA polymerase sigma factor [Paenisporosarcina antarctica]
MTNFEEVLEQYEPMIYACLRKLRIYKNHESFIQVGRIGLWKAWLRFDETKGDFTPFAFRSIYGSLLDELKKETKDDRLVPAEDQILELMVNKHSRTNCIEWSEKVKEALSQLKLHEQQLIHLLFVEGYSLDEVVVHLGVSKSCVKKRRERTLDKLKEMMTN